MNVILDYKKLKELKNLKASQIENIGPDDIRLAAHKTYHISPNGKYLYSVSKPEITYGKFTPSYYILYIYDIDKRRIIDTINQDIGDISNITSNSDGSIISFGSKYRWDFVKGAPLDFPKNAVYTYKRNNDKKYEQYTEPIIEYNIGKDKLIPSRVRKKFPDINIDEYNEKNNVALPDMVYISGDGNKLIVNYHGPKTFINVYYLIHDKDNKKRWKKRQQITEDDFIKDISNIDFNMSISDISEDFTAFLVLDLRSGIALVYRLNSENKYIPKGNYLESVFIKNKWKNGAIDSTGNRIALSVKRKDIVVVYEYNEQNDEWIETQSISRPEDIILREKDRGDIIYGRSMTFTNKGNQLLIGTNKTSVPFVDIYNLDSNDKKYKFDQRLNTMREYVYFGSEDPKTSLDGKRIIIGSSNIHREQGGISIFRKGEESVFSTVKPLSKEEKKKRQEEKGLNFTLS